MKTVTFTESEISTISEYLFTNPCNSCCVMGYGSKIECNEYREDGKRRCRLLRDADSIMEKLGIS